MSKQKYQQSLEKALNNFVQAADELASIARNNSLSVKHRDYSKKAIAERTRQLQKEMDFEPKEFKISLPGSDII